MGRIGLDTFKQTVGGVNDDAKVRLGGTDRQPKTAQRGFLGRAVRWLLGATKQDRADYEEIARRCIAEVRLAGFEHSYPHQLSGGMRQRVGLARALAVDAAILLMDEPFASVDEQTRRKFQEDLLALLEVEKKTVIFVTHSIEEAVYVSDQIVLLSPRPGRVSKIVRPGLERSGDFERIRRARAYLDCVEEIWGMLKRYLED